MDLKFLQMRSNYERLQASTRETKRKHKNLQTQVRNLCEERADFLVQIQDQQRSINGLKQRLGLAEKENEDLSKVRQFIKFLFTIVNGV